MALQTTTRNRRAAKRNSAMNSGAALRLLTRGASTNDKKIVPPIQLTAASRWSQTNTSIIEGPDSLSDLFFRFEVDHAECSSCLAAWARNLEVRAPGDFCQLRRRRESMVDIEGGHVLKHMTAGGTQKLSGERT